MSSPRLSIPGFRSLLRAALFGGATAALAASAACSSPANNNERVGTAQSALSAITCSASYALSGTTITASGGTGVFSTCTYGTKTSGGTCTVTGGALTYTAGPTAGYYIVPQRTATNGTYTGGTYLQVSPVGAINYVEPGGAAGSTSLWIMASSGSGFTFQLAGQATGYMYVPATGTESTAGDVVSNTNAAGAAVFTMTDCNGSAGDGTLTNRFGFKSPAGSNPYWQAQGTAPTTAYIRTGASGNGTPCSQTNNTAWEAFYLVPGGDTITVKDSGGNTGVCTIAVENPISFVPSSLTLTPGGSIPAQTSLDVNAVQAWGGSEGFPTTGGCTVTTNHTGGAGTCTVTGSGQVGYTVGTAGGTDTLTITDTQGHTGTFNVTGEGAISFSPSPVYVIAGGGAVASMATASGGSGTFSSCTIQTNSSGGSAQTVTSAGVMGYTPGATSGVTDVLKVTDSQGNTGLLNVNVVKAVSVLPTSSTANTSSPMATVTASNGTGTFSSCAVATNNSHSTGGCAVTSAGVVSYTAGATAGADTLKVTDSQGHSVTFTVTVSVQSLTFSPTPSYALGSSPMAAVQTSNGTGSYTLSPACTVLTNNSHSTGGCSVSSLGVVSYTAGATTATTDTIQVKDSAGHTGTFTVAIENSISFSPAAPYALGGSPMGTVTASGGSGTFSSCMIQTNSSGGTICSVTGAGAVGYTPGTTTPGTDTLLITDSQGHTKTLNVTVEPPLTFSPTSGTAIATVGTATTTVSGGSGTFSTCVVTTNSSHTTGGCSVTSAGVVTYSAVTSTSAGTDVLTITDSQGHTATFSVVVTSLTPVACTASYALASGSAASITASGGTGVFSGGSAACALGTNTSGGTSCSIASGGAVTYTAGATAGYFIVPQITSTAGTYTGGTYLRSYTTGGFNYVEPGGVVGTSSLWAMASSGTGFTFHLAGQANGYVYLPTGTESSGNDLIANTNAAGATVFTMTDCNGTGDGTLTNRYGFKSPAGGSSYWQAQASTNPGGYVRTNSGGSGSVCSQTVNNATTGFYLIPGSDTLTVTDSGGHTGTCTVAIENPVSLLPSSIALAGGASIAGESSDVNTVQAWGGSGIFTGSSAGCTVSTNNSHSTLGCSVTGSGQVQYTAGNGSGTDTLTVTDSQGHAGTLSVVVTGPYSISTTSSYALASSALGSAVTVSGGTLPYTCAVATGTSGAAACSVGTGGVLTYTAGATAGYNIQAVRTGDYLQIISSTYQYVETGGAIGSSAQLWKMAPSGSGFTFQSAGGASPVGTLSYVRNAGTAGNDLVADQTASGAAVYTRQDCNSSAGDLNQYNRFGFESAGTTSEPYWQTKSATSPALVDAVANGNGSACNAATPAPYEGYFLVPGTDTLTVRDSGGHSSTVTVTVENPVAFMPSPIAVASSTPVSGAFAWGGSGIFTGGSAGCSVVTNVSGSVGGCSVGGSGIITYAAGATSGTDVLLVTDSQGHSATVNVVVSGSISTVGLGTNPIQTVTPKSSTVLTVGGTGATWTLVNNNSGGSINASTGLYTAGATGNVSDLAQVTQSGSTSTVVISVGPGVSVVPTQANVLPSGTKTFTASGGSGTFTGGSAGCTLSTNASGGSCSVSSAGAVIYIAGATSGSDVMKVTDSLGNAATVPITVSCAADASLQILYPYNKTVFPQGLTPPLVQWSDNGSAYYAKISLTYPATGTPIFSWSEIVPENGTLTSPYNKLPTTLPVTGGGRAQISSLAWNTLQTSASGADALLTVQTLESGKATLGASVTIHFATAQLKGTIYYQSYDTGLVTPSTPPNGATLAITVGASTPTVVDGSSTACRDCHSVSASGNRMIINNGSSYGTTNLYGASMSVALPANTETAVSPGAGTSPNDGRFTWAGLSPDGTVMFTHSGNEPVYAVGNSGNWGNTTTVVSGVAAGTSVSALQSGLYSVSTGLPLTTSGLATGFQAKFPAFATDTSALAFNYSSYDGESLATMSVSQSGSTWVFGTPNVLFTPPTAPSGYPIHSGTAAWPSFMPAGQNGVVVQNQVADGCTEQGADDCSCNPGSCSDVRHNIGALGELWWVNTSGTPVPTKLAAANGAGYLPLGPNGHGAAGTTVPSASTYPSDTAGGIPSAAQLTALGAASCQTALGNIFGNGNDALENFKPTVNPQVTGGYQWVVFMSRRMYGNVATINPYASDPRNTTEIQSTATTRYPEPKKLWVAAMSTSPTAGSDPSYPAFYLDGQELYSGNSRSYWVLPQCIAPSATLSSATVCTSTQDCCQTTPSTCKLDIPITTDPATEHCVPNTAITCSPDGGSCNVDGDCCNLVSEGTRCSAGICQVPPAAASPGYPSSASVTYDFQSNCATGTAPVWEFLQTDQIVPTGTSVSFAVQSASTEATLTAAQSATAGTATTTVQSPMYWTDVTTVDQDLRALSPPSISSTWLRVTVTLNPSSNKTAAPTFVSMTPTFDCAPSE